MDRKVSAMLATPVNMLIALVIAGLVVVPVPLEPQVDAAADDVLAPKESAPGGNAPGGSDGPNGANKMASSSDSVDVFEGVADTKAILDASVKLSTPMDMIVSLTMECALWTEVIVHDEPSMGPTNSRAETRIVAWPEVDGEAAGPEVVFCDRVREIELIEQFTGEDDDNDNLTMRDYMATRSANAFNWLLFNPLAGAADNVIDVVIQARMEQSVTEDSQNTAYGAVGARTLVLNPVRLD